MQDAGAERVWMPAGLKGEVLGGEGLKEDAGGSYMTVSAVTQRA